jgi:hypothetical protein
VWEVVERAEVAARPGKVWHIVSDIAEAGEQRAFAIDVANEPRELAWTSLASLYDGAGVHVEVRWWFRLAPNWTGTELEHGVGVEHDPTASEQLDVRRRLVATLANVKARAET